ncbi:leader peptidase (prepilin peptidase)/N-methyltransferase [Fusobacterium sp. PH5-44]
MIVAESYGKNINIYIILIMFLIISIIICDIKRSTIPNSLNFLFLFFSIIFKGFTSEIVEKSVLGAAIYILPIIFIYGYLSDILQKEVIGFGDIKLILGIGYILEYKSFYEIYLYYLIAFSIASCYIFISWLIFSKKLKKIPFAPFLLISFIYLYVRKFYELY